MVPGHPRYKADYYLGSHGYSVLLLLVFCAIADWGNADMHESAMRISANSKRGAVETPDEKSCSLGLLFVDGWPYLVDTNTYFSGSDVTVFLTQDRSLALKMAAPKRKSAEDVLSSLIMERSVLGELNGFLGVAGLEGTVPRGYSVDKGSMSTLCEEQFVLMDAKGQRKLDKNVRKISERQLLLATAQLLRIVREVHKHGVIHGDLHFGNIVFDSDPVASLSLIDFGETSLFIDPITGAHIHPGSRVPVPGENHLVLTPFELDGELSSRRDDVFQILFLALYLFNAPTTELFSSQSRGPAAVAQAKREFGDEKSLPELTAMLRESVALGFDEEPPYAKWIDALERMVETASLESPLARIPRNPFAKVPASRVVEVAGIPEQPQPVEGELPKEPSVYAKPPPPGVEPKAVRRPNPFRRQAQDAPPADEERKGPTPIARPPNSVEVRGPNPFGTQQAQLPSPGEEVEAQGQGRRLHAFSDLMIPPIHTEVMPSEDCRGERVPSPRHSLDGIDVGSARRVWGNLSSKPGVVRKLELDSERCPPAQIVVDGDPVTLKRGPGFTGSEASLFISTDARLAVKVVNSGDRARDSLAAERAVLPEIADMSHSTAAIHMAVAGVTEACAARMLVTDIAGRVPLKFLPQQPVAVVAAIAAEAIGILRALHAHGIVHGDIHRGNWIVRDRLSPVGTLRLIDFGRAKPFVNPDGSHVALSSNSVDPDLNKNFLSPWELMELAQSRRDDMFRLAEVLYRMLPGKLKMDKCFRRRETNADRALAEQKLHMSLPEQPAIFSSFHHDMAYLSFQERPNYERWIDEFEKLAATV